jgi:hypothetical protein
MKSPPSNEIVPAEEFCSPPPPPVEPVRRIPPADRRRAVQQLFAFSVAEFPQLVSLFAMDMPDDLSCIGGKGHGEVGFTTLPSHWDVRFAGYAEHLIHDPSFLCSRNADYLDADGHDPARDLPLPIGDAGAFDEIDRALPCLFWIERRAPDDDCLIGRLQIGGGGDRY